MPLQTATTILRKAQRAVELVLAAGPGARWSTTKSIVRSRARRTARQVRRGVFDSEVRAIDAVFGTERANQFFWAAPFGDTSWSSTAARLEELADGHPELVDHFVRSSLEQTRDPITIASLARHPFSIEAVSAWLVEQADDPSPDFLRRTRGNRFVGGAVAGAARVLLEPDIADRLGDTIVDLYQTLDSRLLQFVDSFGITLTEPSVVPRAASTLRSGTGEQARHRLVIAEHFKDPESIALLLPGAQKITLIATSETFGHADFSDYLHWPGIDDIVVEHVRSRITRFSQPYIDLHESTAAAAREITDHVMELADLTEHVDERFLSVEIADFLFFQALAIRALEVLVESQEFDEIVLALDAPNLSARFVRLVKQVTGLLDDPRLEIVSVANSPAGRAAFWSLIDQLTADVPDVTPERRRIARSLVVRKFNDEGRRLGTPPEPAPADRSIVVVTTNQPAYNDSTAVYVHELRRDHEVQVLHIGGNPADLLSELEGLDGAHDPRIDVIATSANRLVPATHLIGDHLRRRLPSDPIDHASAAERAAAAALQINLDRLAGGCIAPAMVRMKAIHHWLAGQAAADRSPDVIVVTPHRNPGVGVIEVIARRFGTPTIVVEPHAQDANYCRYVKVVGDYYGVMSDYFNDTASAGFGIDPARIVTVGSPRQIAPPGYEHDTEQRAARRRYEQEHGVDLGDGRLALVFFCQPSDWTHVSKVWANVLEAAQRHRCRVLLKPHPEESNSRVAGYLADARARPGAEVVLLDVDAAEAVALADVVLTGYSAAALDAAVRQTPVVCVTDGDAGYPVDIAAIVDAPLARSADELADLLQQHRDDPEATRKRARRVIEEQHQFVEGPGPRLRQLVAEVIASGPDATLPPSAIPTSLFLDGPHPVYPV